MKNKRSSWRSWANRNSGDGVVKNSSGKKNCCRWACHILLYSALVNVLFAESVRDYRRAQSLVSSDPLEAEALYERFLANAKDIKRRRAANYELFFLRLKHARLIEAFTQADNKSLGKKYYQAVADQFTIQRHQASVLVHNLRAACKGKKSAAHVGEYLRRHNLPAPLWDFSLRVLKRCTVENRSTIFSDDLFETPNAARSVVLLRLMAIREQLYTDAEKAEQLLLFTRQDAERYADDTALAAQFAVLEARIADEREDYEKALRICDSLDHEEVPAQAVTSCNLFAAHALLRLGHAERAFRRIAKVSLARQNLDGRLLRLVIGVEAGKVERRRLKQFTQRASYRYCARRLRDLAAATLASTGGSGSVFP